MTSVYIKVGISSFILVLLGMITFDITGDIFLTMAVVIAAFMAINIGANDVANNVGPAFGAGVLTLLTALVLAAIFEAAGALIAGGDVVKTIKKGIIDPGLINDVNVFIWIMMAALLAGGIWLAVATYKGWPVSTTHSIVGAVAGAGIAAGGFDIVSWPTLGKIAASWVISPLMGSLISAAFLYSIKMLIVYKDDCIAEAKKVIPYMIAIMTWAIVTYLILKGLKKIWIDISPFIPFIEITNKPDFITASLVALVASIFVFFFVKPRIAIKAHQVDSNKDGINKLFRIPLIISAAALCFAHGANDVANAVGPLAAIVDSLTTGAISTKASIPVWVMILGAGGIVIGLGFFGGRIIRKVGQEITDMSPIRAFSVAMGSTITVIIASQLGLPVSSTHIAVGGVFAIGFLKEHFDKKDQEILEQEQMIIAEKKRVKSLSAQMEEFKATDELEQVVELQEQVIDTKKTLKGEKKDLNKMKKGRDELKQNLKEIGLAWIITVPASATIAGMIFFTIRGIMI